MARTTANDVKALLADYESTVSFDPFIEAASAIVTQHCIHEDLTVTDLELIERWLSAHFYCVYDPRTVNEKAGSVGATFESKVDLGFNLTKYGQMAMRLDWSGALAALDQRTKNGKGTTVGLTWAGIENPNAVNNNV